MATRYSIGDYGAEEDLAGAFIRVADYAALEKQLADLKRRVKEARDAHELFAASRADYAQGIGTESISLADFDRILPEGKEK